MNDRVSMTIENGVADVRMVRVDKMNALDTAMFEALVAAGERLKTEPGVRAAVLSGEGRGFCAGIDLGNFQAAASAAPGEPHPISNLSARTHGIANLFQSACWTWRTAPVPVIAAVHGVAFGGGFQVALGCDMRFVTRDARLSVMEAKWGLVPDMAGTLLMRHLAREDLVRELTYTARIFSGEEALAYGFATRVCADPLAEALAMAREIADKSPHAIRAAKRLLNAAADADAARALAAESTEADALIGSANQTEAVMSNLEKRAPAYVDP